MRRETRKRQWEDRRLNLFWRKNKTFTLGSEEMRKLPIRRNLGFGGVSTIRKQMKDGKRTERSGEPSMK